MASLFLQSIRDDMRLRGYALKTEKTYLVWIRMYIRFQRNRHPAEMGPDEIKSFLTWLAVDRHVSVNTQKVALNSLVYLYQKFLNRELGELGFSLARRQRHLPIVLSRDEVGSILSFLSGRNQLLLQLMYGSGLRVNECLRLRIQDLDLEHLALTIHDGKGHKDRKTLLGMSLLPALNAAIQMVPWGHSQLNNLTPRL